MCELGSSCHCGKCRPKDIEADCCGKILTDGYGREVGGEIWCDDCFEASRELCAYTRRVADSASQDVAQLLELVLHYNRCAKE